MKKSRKKIKSLDLKAEKVWEKKKDPNYSTLNTNIKTSFQLQHPQVYVQTKGTKGGKDCNYTGGYILNTK